MPFSILNFKWAWQAHFLGHTPVTLKFYVFFIDVQMLLVSFFEILSRFGVICKKPIFFYQSRPLTVQNGTKYTVSDLDFKRKICFLQITQKRF